MLGMRLRVHAAASAYCIPYAAGPRQFGALAVSFFALLSLLSITTVSFAVPATAVSYLLETLLAKYILGEDVRWRLLNASDVNHPMHLHGSYYRVESSGDGERDHVFPASEERT